MEERRQAVRVPWVTEVECEEFLSGTRHPSAQLANISLTGLFLYDVPMLPMGTILLLRFTLPSLKMVVAAVVVHTIPGDGLGLRFLDLTPIHRVVIRELMKPEALAPAPEPLELPEPPPVAAEEPSPRANGPEPDAPRSDLAEPDAPKPDGSTEPEKRPRRILVVDDHDRTRTMLRGMIEGRKKKFVVTEARDGEECLQIAREQPPFDLIFLDVDMPRLDGLGACRQLRALGVTSPIIFLTGRNELDDFRAGREAGADTYIKKPILLGTLRSMLGLFTSGSIQRR